MFFESKAGYAYLKERNFKILKRTINNSATFEIKSCLSGTLKN